MTSILNELQKNNNAAAVDPTIIDTINNLVRLMGEIKEGSQ